MRWDRRHLLEGEARSYLTLPTEPGFGWLNLRYQYVKGFGWHDFWVKSRGHVSWGDVTFHDEFSIGELTRGLFSNQFTPSGGQPVARVPLLDHARLGEGEATARPGALRHAGARAAPWFPRSPTRSAPASTCCCTTCFSSTRMSRSASVAERPWAPRSRTCSCRRRSRNRSGLARPMQHWRLQPQAKESQ